MSSGGEQAAHQQNHMSREDYMKQRLVQLWAEVDAAARASIRTNPEHPYLSQMQRGALRVDQQQRYSSAVQPRVQESRNARRPTPLDRPVPRTPTVDALWHASKHAGGASDTRVPTVGVTPAVGPTPGTSLVLSPAGAAAIAASSALAEAAGCAPRVAAASESAGDGKADDLSQDEAASLLMALPMSREPSGPLPSLASPPLQSPRITPGAGFGGLPMNKTLSGLSVSGCLSLLDGDSGDGAPLGSPSPRPGEGTPVAGASGGAATWSSLPSPRMPGVSMTKVDSISGFLSMDRLASP